MIFLIEYSRLQGRIVTFKTFEESDRDKAANERLEMELQLNQQRINHEVVLLEAASQEALRRTHRRYFESVRQIATSA